MPPPQSQLLAMAQQFAVLRSNYEHLMQESGMEQEAIEADKEMLLNAMVDLVAKVQEEQHNYARHYNAILGPAMISVGAHMSIAAAARVAVQSR